MNASNYSVDRWSERDRLGIWVTDNQTGRTVAEFWDDAARELFDDGFFDARNLKASVLDYCLSVGFIMPAGQSDRHNQNKYDHACGYAD